MELAGKISSQDMQAIAVQRLGFDISEVKTLLAVHREDHRMMKFEILDRWKNKNRRNNRQVTIYFVTITKRNEHFGKNVIRLVISID